MSWVYLVVVGQCQFFILTLLAMYIYPGGYRFSEHFFSDLGVLTTVQGFDNSVSSSIFSVSIFLLASSQSLFWLKITSLLPNKKFNTGIMVMGCVSCIGLALIGITPVDSVYFLHVLAVAVWIIPFIISTAMIYLSTRCDVNLAGVRILTLGLSIVSSIHLFCVATIVSPINVVIQKIVVYYLLLWFCLIPFQLKKLGEVS